jgi:hypothetical protein
MSLSTRTLHSGTLFWAAFDGVVLSHAVLLAAGVVLQVYRGTWKHTDIAAKEYLPIEPAADVPTGSNKADSPSDAAMAHARVRQQHSAVAAAAAGAGGRQQQQLLRS